jgi:hypothetical protein
MTEDAFYEWRTQPFDEWTAAFVNVELPVLFSMIRVWVFFIPPYRLLSTADCFLFKGLKLFGHQAHAGRDLQSRGATYHRSYYITLSPDRN